MAGPDAVNDVLLQHLRAQYAGVLDDAGIARHVEHLARARTARADEPEGALRKQGKVFRLGDSGDAGGGKGDGTS